MISNEERREVANWLRLSGESLGFDNCFVQMLCDVEGTNLPPEDFDAAGYLADLIDRPTCRNIYAETEGMGGCENGFKCSECGNTVEDYEGYRISGEFNYCSKCGAEVIE